MEHLVEDPFDFLKKDHAQIAALLKKLEDGGKDAMRVRRETFMELHSRLSLHMEIEERALYPALKDDDRTEERAEAAIEEHHVIKLLLNELAAMTHDTDHWAAKLFVLRENVAHHIKEEEGDLFKKARLTLGEDRLAGIAANMNAYLTVRAEL